MEPILLLPPASLQAGLSTFLGADEGTHPINKIVSRFNPKLLDWLQKYPSFIWPKFAPFSPDAQETIVDTLKPLRPGQNLLAEIIDLLSGIAKRNGVEEALKELTKAATAGSLDEVRDALKTCRYPRLMEKQREFGSKLAALGLPRGIQVTPKAFFEDDSIEIKWRVQSREEFASLLPTITNIQSLFDTDTN